MKEGRERRRSRRRQFDGVVQVLEHRAGRWDRGVGRDVSSLGMFLTTGSRYVVGEEVTVRFSLPGGSFEIEVQGRIVRVEGPQDPPHAGVAGVAIEFNEAPEWAMSEVSRFIREEPGESGAAVIRK